MFGSVSEPVLGRLLTPPATTHTTTIMMASSSQSIRKAAARGPTPTGARSIIARVYRRPA